MIHAVTARGWFVGETVYHMIRPSIGFVGLGNMGRHMAKNLLSKGEKVLVFDVNRSAVGDFEYSPLPQLFERSKLVISMLPDGKVVDSILSDDNVKYLDKDGLFIDCSTIQFTEAQAIQRKLAKFGRRFIDAPVSGGVPGAQQGTLSFMVGGSQAEFEEAKPTLLKMGSAVFHCGEVGSGQLAKMVNNLMLAISMLGVSEVFHLGMRAGLDPKIILNVLNSSSGRCWVTEKYCPVPGQQPLAPASRGYEGGFASKLMLKDLKIAESAQKNLQSMSVLGSQTIKAFERMVSDYPSTAGKDFSIIFKHLFSDNPL